jgi:hypothetical protein
MDTTHSFVPTGDTNRSLIDPDALGKMDIVQAKQDDIEVLLDFIARYVRKVHSDVYIRSTMKKCPTYSFLDVIGPSDIAYLFVLFKNSQHVWDQDIRLSAEGGGPEKKNKPLFSTGDGKKREVGKSLWSKEGRRYFSNMEDYWRDIYDNTEAMTILNDKWNEWLESKSKGRDIRVGDGAKTYHYVMGTWYDDDEIGKLKNDNISEDEEEDGYSSERPQSRHQRARMKGELGVMDDNKRNTHHTSKDEDYSSSSSSEIDSPSGQKAAGVSGSPARGGGGKVGKGGLSKKLFSRGGASQAGSPAGDSGSKVGKGNDGKGQRLFELRNSGRSPVNNTTTRGGANGGSPATNTRLRGGAKRQKY